MSRQPKRRSRNRILPWIPLVLGGALVLIALIMLAGRGSGGTPTLVVDQEIVNYGDVKFNTTRSFAIRVTNTGDGTLRFREPPYIEVLEGC